jgi:hypothetical protein
MATIVEEQYRVNMYLDTNILVDYVEKKYPLLNKSIDFLAQSPFVNLRSSHYVLFEFTEVRKVGLFWQKAAPNDSEDYKKARNTIRSCWKYNGRDYNEFKADISAQVKSELEMLRSGLSLDFDDHVLHEELVYPTNSLCLATKISKEDCLVMISCMNPYKQQKLDHCLLLSRDEQYYKAYEENKDEAEKVFSDSGLNKPTMIRTESLQVDEHGTKYNLYENDEHVDIVQFWKSLILKTIKGKLSDTYVGSTYLHGASEVARKCIYFNMDGDDKILKKSEGLVFITRDLSDVVILGGPFEFWNNEKVELPHSNPDDPKYSFLAHGMKPEVLNKLRETGNLVFYYDLVS